MFSMCYMAQIDTLLNLCALICRTMASFSESKNVESSENSELSSLVPRTGLF